MKAIILAAGIGRRIQAHTKSPKCLLRFNDKSLLARHIELLQNYPISELIIVTGYLKKQIEEELKRIQPSIKVATLFNERYREGSIISLNIACEYLDDVDTVILMDADVIYHQEILDTLISSSNSNSLLLDRNFEEGDEPVKICVKDHKIIEFRKKPASDIDYDLIGESVGFFKFSNKMFIELNGRTKEYVEQQKTKEPYEEVIRDLLLKYPDDFCYEDITGIPWMEIDFPEDITIVKQNVLPAIPM